MWPRNLKLPEKKFQKSGREENFRPRKKPKKVPKNGFSGTFHFLGEKKNTVTRALPVAGITGILGSMDIFTRALAVVGITGILGSSGICTLARAV